MWYTSRERLKTSSTNRFHQSQSLNEFSRMEELLLFDSYSHTDTHHNLIFFYSIFTSHMHMEEWPHHIFLTFADNMWTYNCCVRDAIFTYTHSTTEMRIEIWHGIKMRERDARKASQGKQIIFVYQLSFHILPPHHLDSYHSAYDWLIHFVLLLLLLLLRQSRLTQNFLFACNWMELCEHVEVRVASHLCHHLNLFIQ